MQDVTGCQARQNSIETRNMYTRAWFLALAEAATEIRTVGTTSLNLKLFIGQKAGAP